MPRRLHRSFADAGVLQLAAAIVVAFASFELARALGRTVVGAWRTRLEPDGYIPFPVGDQVGDLGPLLASVLTFVAVAALALRRAAR